jgi:hypothetical protein
MVDNPAAAGRGAPHSRFGAGVGRRIGGLLPLPADTSESGLRAVVERLRLVAVGTGARHSPRGSASHPNRQHIQGASLAWFCPICGKAHPVHQGRSSECN